MPLAILTYHPMRIHGDDAASNDLVAFTEDVRYIAQRGWQIVPLRDAIDRWLEDPEAHRHPTIALACDDGSDFDFVDLHHPTCGLQRSIYNRLLDANREGIDAHVTSFTIVSPHARTELDRKCMVGGGWWNEAWWRPAVESGVMHVANHSWDHNHDLLPDEIGLPVARGTFTSIDSQRLADMEIRLAQDYLRQAVPNPGLGLFAFPYGEASSFVIDYYLPREAARLGLVAAFGTEPGLVTCQSNRWFLPRFVHARDWHVPEELGALFTDRR